MSRVTGHEAQGTGEARFQWLARPPEHLSSTAARVNNEKEIGAPDAYEVEKAVQEGWIKPATPDRKWKTRVNNLMQRAPIGQGEAEASVKSSGFHQRSFEKEVVAARLPRQLLKALQKIEEVEQSDRSAIVRKLLYRAVADWKKDYAARLYGERKLTLERAAMEAEVGVREMMEYLRQKKIPGQYDLSELEEDMARLYKNVALSRSP